MNYLVKSIGKTFTNENGFGIELNPEYRKATKGLEGFSHVQVIWWFCKCDNDKCRNKLVEQKPYKSSPETLGTFATRSPERPNPIAITTAYVTYLDENNGIIGLAWNDAFDGSPVLDVKPYTPSADRVENPKVPNWCNHWPKNVESSGDFDWSKEFNF